MISFLADLSPTALQGFICTDERLEATQRRPTSDEAETLEAYRRDYRQALGFWPHGLHYLPFPGEAETGAVWFPPAEPEE